MRVRQVALMLRLHRLPGYAEGSVRGTITMANIDASADEDPYAWLEEIDAPQARAWVEARNAETRNALCDARFEQDRIAALDILNAPGCIPWVIQRSGLLYNFWRDEQNPKGLWRRTTPASYRTAAPDWEVILDLDALARAAVEAWVWHGCTTMYPAPLRGPVQLSQRRSAA